MNTLYNSGGTRQVSGIPGTRTVSNPSGTNLSNINFGATNPAPSTQAAAPAVDPYAKYGGQSAYNSLVNQYNTQKNNLYSTAYDAADNSGRQYGSSIIDFVDSLRSGQRNIDNMAVNNELGKLQGTRSVYDSVGRGLQSGSVMLNNKNAASSSAADALARAYGDIGRRELTSVNNDYNMGQRDIGQAQLSFDEQRASGVRKLEDSKANIVNSIVTEARGQLAALNAAAEKATLPDRVDIEREKEAIKAQVMQRLQQYDQQLSTGVGGIAATGADQRMAEANQLANAGVVGPEQFDLTTSIPAQFQGTGPFASALPIFTYRRQNER